MPAIIVRSALVLACALLVVTCANAEDGDAGPEDAAEPTAGDVDIDQPGVTDTEIRVGAVASVTNPLGGRYDALFEGARAHFEMVNEQGGVHGRELSLASERDDETLQNQREVRALIEQDDVFAAFVATLVFSGADLLADEGIPTLGWNINPEWSGPPNFFGEKGSYFEQFSQANALVPWLAREVGAEEVGIVAYNLPQSTACAEGDQEAFEIFGGAEVAFVDTSLPYGQADFSGDVAEMIDREVDLVLTCIDENGAAVLAQEMRKQGLDAPLYLPNAYNHEFIEQFGDVLDGSYVLTFFAPFELEEKPPGLQEYLDRTEASGAEPHEVGLAGWIAADMLVTGLELAGGDFTRQGVVDELNTLTDYDAGGILPGTDWTVQHDGRPDELCFSLLEVTDGGLTPRFGEPERPFLCFDRDATELPDEPTRRG